MWVCMQNLSCSSACMAALRAVVSSQTYPLYWLKNRPWVSAFSPLSSARPGENQPFSLWRVYSTLVSVMWRSAASSTCVNDTHPQPHNARRQINWEQTKSMHEHQSTNSWRESAVFTQQSQQIDVIPALARRPHDPEHRRHGCCRTCRSN